MGQSLIAIDQGTTSSRAIRFGPDLSIHHVAQRELTQHYPQPGWVEHDPDEIWTTTLACLGDAMSNDVSAIGITNQRETIIIWDRASGKPIHNAIVWQDRRTAELCATLKADGIEPMIQQKTGLLLDPYFSATKIKWLLDTIPNARERANRGELAAGTIDTFLLWRLTGGRVHATDWTNASRTMAYNIHTQKWDADLLRLFDIPESILPNVHDNVHHFGDTDTNILGRSIPIFGMAGDQQSALIGQACFDPGMIKTTYGTGCFALINTGTPCLSMNRLLTTPAYAIGNTRHYALEGSIFVAGAAIKWLRDKLGLIATATETEGLAKQAKEDHGLALIPAFVGLGAPHWRPDLRASLHGMTFDTGKADLVRATLEALAFQTRDLIEAMIGDDATQPKSIRIDGGMSQNAWFAQYLADVIGIPVEVPHSHETTAMGAAILAGIGAGIIDDIPDAKHHWTVARRWQPTTDRSGAYHHWRRILESALKTLPA